MTGRSARVVAATLGFLAATSPLLPAAAVPGADPAAPTVEVVVEKIGPVVLKPKGTLTVVGSVINRGTAPLRAPTVSLELRRRAFTFRAELAAAADDRTPLRDGVEVAEVVLPDPVAPGASAPWKLAVKAADLALPGNGVYPLAVGVGSGRAPALDTRTTFLPYLPDPKSYTPTKVSWLWPLAANPMRGPEGDFPKTTAGAAFAAPNRLYELATAPGARSVGWFVDPQLLDDASALAGPHREIDNGEVEKAAGNESAELWLGALRQELTGKPNAATPYADPDMLGLVDGNTDGLLAQALDRARAITTTVLGRQSDTSAIWPPGGLTDEATRNALHRLGARTLVMSSEQFPVLGTLSYTPTGRALVATDDGDLEVLISDDGLTKVLEGDLKAPGAFALAQQRLLAETALITLERPNVGRAVLMAPPRRWDPPAAGAKRLLAVFAAAPWMTASTLDTLSQTRVPAELVATEVDDRPALEARRLPQRYVAGGRDSLRAVAGEARSLRAVFADDENLGTDPEAAVLRAASSSWIADVPGGRGYLAKVGEWVRADAGKVKILGRRGVVTLAGSRGTIPVTVQNGLSRPIRIRPTIVPVVSGRLRARSPELLTIAAGRSRTVSIPAEAAANGITRVRLELRDAEGNTYGQPTFLRVNVTNYGSVGLIVVLGGGGLLFAVAIVRNIRRVQRHRQHTAGQSRSEAPERSDDAEEPVQL
ncbi:MAG: DUF6049 family protein [Sporichthyaceae bacterium]